MAKTFTFTVNAIGDPEAVTVVTACKRVTVGEDESVANYPTTSFSMRPDILDVPRRIGAGKTYTFYRETYWAPGQICGYVDIPSGTTTFFQDEGS